VINNRNLYYFTAILLAFLFVMPFGYLVEFTNPAKDDFCLAMSFNEYPTLVKKWYFNLNGRYINALITSVPFVGNELRKLFLYFLFIFTGIILYVFSKKIMNYYRIKDSNPYALLLSTLFYITIIAKAPSLNELFYWYSSATVYLLSFLFFLIFLISVLKTMMGYRAPFITIGFTAVLLNGNNELFIGITNFLLFLLLVKSFLQNRVLNFSFLILNIVSWLSSAAFIFSPGSTNRQQQFDYGGNLIGSLKVAVIYGGKFIFESLLDPTYFFFYLFTFILFYRYSEIKKKKVLNPLHLMIVSFICLGSMFFIVYYATGLFSIRTGRIGDVVSMVMLTFVFLNIINIAVFFKTRKRIIYIDRYYLQLIAVVGFVGSLLIVNKNYLDAHSDFVNGRFQAYRKEFKSRDSILKQSENEKITLKPIKGTHIMHSGDGYLEGEEIMKNCYIRYVNRKYDKDFTEIKIKKP
jgi:hypothetical protein